MNFNFLYNFNFIIINTVLEAYNLLSFKKNIQQPTQNKYGTNKNKKLSLKFVVNFPISFINKLGGLDV